MNNNIQNTFPKNKGEIEAALLWAITNYLGQTTETKAQIIGALQAYRIRILDSNATANAQSGAIVRLIEAIEAMKNKGEIEAALMRAITNYLGQTTEIIGALQACRLCIQDSNATADTQSVAIVRLIGAIEAMNDEGKKNLPTATTP